MEKATTVIGGIVVSGIVMGVIAGLGYAFDSYVTKKREKSLCKLEEAYKIIRSSLDCQSTLDDAVWINLMNETIKDCNKVFGKDIVAEVMLLKGFIKYCGKYRKTIEGVEFELSVA